MREYDLIFVIGYFRSATAFLSIIKALGSQLRIAVLFVDADPTMQRKTGDAHNVFAELCQQFGAELVSLGVPIRAELLVVQQFPYNDELAQAIQLNIRVARRAGLMSLAMAGLEKHDIYLTQFGIRKVYVPSLRFMDFLLDERKGHKRYQDVAVEQVGLPFARYPPFPEFAVDWIIAAPTLFSFHSEKGKQQYLQSVNQLLGQIPPDDVVVYKSHNGNCRDYFAPRVHYWLAGLLESIPAARLLPRLARSLQWSWLHIQGERVRSCILHRAILKRAIPMDRLTSYAGISIEAFLPGVRKGVIGGLSNTIWGSLYFNLPYYNCVDDAFRLEKSELLDKRSDALLDLNLRYFGVPYCRGVLSVDIHSLSVVQPHEREGDLITAVMADLEHARATHGIAT